MQIYVACGLTHVPRHIFDQYCAYIHSLASAIEDVEGVKSVQYALVDSDPQLSLKPSTERSTLCYEWDRRMVERANLVVADASFPSTGLGIELQIAENRGTPIVMLIGDLGVNRTDSVRYDNPDGTSHDLQVGAGIVSLMALGLPNIHTFIEYSRYEGAVYQARTVIETYMRSSIPEPETERSSIHTVK